MRPHGSTPGASPGWQAKALAAALVCVLSLFSFTGHALLAQTNSGQGTLPDVLPNITAESKDGGFRTNGPAVFRLTILTVLTPTRNPTFVRPDDPIFSRLSNRLSAEALEKYKKVRLSQSEYRTNVGFYTNSMFAHYVPGTLHNQLWTNLMARTNGRTMKIWAERRHPLFWPAKAPVVRWQKDGLMYGMKGSTALSPCWEQEGAPGQVPVTALTPRHGYTRGHGMGPQGYKRAFAGRKVWFLTAQDKMVDVRVTGAITRTSEKGDYTVLMFNKDLPPSIEPARVAAGTNVSQHYPWPPSAPYPIMFTEQTGNVHVGLPGFDIPYMKGGDSGSPNFIPYVDEVIFISGRTTSGPSAAMQEDINELCRREKVSPERYQLRWVDLSKMVK